MAISPSAYNAQHARAIDPIFVEKIKIAIVTAAIAVQAEVITTPFHNNRSNFAQLVLLDPDKYAPILAFSVASNPAIVDASTDSDIQFTVNSQWTAWSGAV